MTLAIEENVIDVVDDVELGDWSGVLLFFLEFVVAVGIVLPALKPFL